MSEYEDIVEELLDWADIIERSQGKASLIILSGEVYRAAAEEIIKLRKAGTELANMIKLSEKDFIDEQKWDETISSWYEISKNKAVVND